MKISFPSFFSNSKKTFTRSLKDNRGVAAVEFALLAPVLILAFIGVASYGLAMFEQMELTSAARAGAQVALIDTTDTDAIKAAVVAASNSSITTTDVTVTETCECADLSTVVCGEICGDNTANRYISTITVTEDYTLLLIPTTLTLTGSAIFRTY